MALHLARVTRFETRVCLSDGSGGSIAVSVRSISKLHNGDRLVGAGQKRKRENTV